MKSILALIILNILAISAFSAEPSPAIRPYKDWKADKIQVVQAKMTQLKAQIENIKATKLQDTKGSKTASYESLIHRYEQESAQVQWNLEVAQDLSVTDYVVLYLSIQTPKNRFQEAAAHLAPAEVAELLEAYSEAMGPSPSQPLGVSTTALKAGSTGLLSK